MPLSEASTAVAPLICKLATASPGAAGPKRTEMEQLADGANTTKAPQVPPDAINTNCAAPVPVMLNDSDPVGSPPVLVSVKSKGVDSVPAVIEPKS